MHVNTTATAPAFGLLSSTDMVTVCVTMAMKYFEFVFLSTVLHSVLFFFFNLIYVLDAQKQVGPGP